MPWLSILSQATQWIIQSFRSMNPNSPSISSNSSSSSSSPTSSPIPPSWSTHASNIAIFHCLLHPGPNRPALPLEIVLQILSHPTRHILTHSVHRSVPCNVRDRESSILHLPPLTAQEIKLLRKISFSFTSKDQGWSDYTQHHGTFNGSWTWFEAAVKRGSSSASPDSTDDRRLVKKTFELQRNRHGGRTFEKYDIAFEEGDPRMAELKEVLEEGDVIELMACAKFPGWVNHVDEAKIEVWSLDDVASEHPLKELGLAVTDGAESA